MKSTPVSSKAFKRSASVNKEAPEQPFGSLQDVVSRVRVAKTRIPTEARSEQRLAQIGNLVALDRKYVEGVRKEIELSAKRFRDKISKQVVTTTIGLDQALEWVLVMLKDGLSIESTINVDIVHLLDAAANISMLEGILTNLKISKSSRDKLLATAIEKSMEHAYANIAKDKGMGERTPSSGLVGMLTDPRLRAMLREQDGAHATRPSKKVRR